MLGSSGVMVPFLRVTLNDLDPVPINSETSFICNLIPKVVFRPTQLLTLSTGAENGPNYLERNPKLKTCSISLFIPEFCPEFNEI